MKWIAIGVFVFILLNQGVKGENDCVSERAVEWEEFLESPCGWLAKKVGITPYEEKRFFPPPK